MAAISRAAAQFPRLAGSARGRGMRLPTVGPMAVMTPPYRVRPSAPTDGTLSRLFSCSGGEKDESPTRDVLRSSGGGEKDESRTRDVLRSSGGGEKDESPTRDVLRSSGGGEEGKFTSVPDGIPNQPQAVVDPGDTHRHDKLLHLLERLEMNKDQKILERASMVQQNKMYISPEQLEQLVQHDKKLSDLAKRIDECDNKIKDVETETKLLNQKYDFFKENNDTRIQNVQYGVVKNIAGMVTFVAGGAVAWLKLKDFITGWKQWFD